MTTPKAAKNPATKETVGLRQECPIPLANRLRIYAAVVNQPGNQVVLDAIEEYLSKRGV